MNQEYRILENQTHMFLEIYNCMIVFTLCRAEEGEHPFDDIIDVFRFRIHTLGHIIDLLENRGIMVYVVDEQTAASFRYKFREMPLLWNHEKRGRYNISLIFKNDHEETLFRLKYL